MVATNSLFSAILWDGSGTPGDWEDPANWDKNRVPNINDDVIIDGAYNVTLESNTTIQSLRLRNGASLTIAASYTLTVFNNGSDGVKIENTGGTLTVNGTLNSYDHSDNGIELDSLGAVMIINGTVNTYDNDYGVFLQDACVLTLNGTLNSYLNGNDGIKLNGDGATLTVNGTLNSYENTKDGIDVDGGNFLVIPSSGEIYSNDNISDGIIFHETVTNDGLISISNPGKVGLNTGGNNNFLYNYGIITVVGGNVGIDGKDTGWDLFNYSSGTITLTESDTLIDDGTDLNNFGTLIGDGYLENGNSGDVSFKPGSTLEPGPSVGQLTFYEAVDFREIMLNIDIEGSTTPGTDYDHIIVQDGPNHNHGGVTLTGAILTLIGNYVPQAGDEFMIIEKIASGPIIGTFSGLPNNSILVYKGGELMISYNGGDGNDVTFTALGPLPVELIDFSVQAMENEVKLTWTTASETNNEFFTIERSLDGRTFEAVATILGNGTTTEISNYAYVDTNPERGLNYYRLKQTDFDGQFSYSDIKTAELKNNETIKVYPTLVCKVVNIETENDVDGETTITIRDLTGRDYKPIPVSSMANKIAFSLEDLNPGIYFVVVSTRTTVFTQKIIKQ